jgi:hypothetical protein
VGTIANLAAVIALGILQAKMKEAMLKDLENMPKPRVDRQAAASFFANPSTAKAIRLIDLMNKNLEPFGRELDEHHAKIVAGTNAEVALLALSEKLSVDERLEFLTGLHEQLEIYERELNVVFDNLQAAKGLSAKALDAARGAEELANLVGRDLVADWLLQQGFSVDEIYEIWNNLKSYASQVRRVFADVDGLHVKVKKLLQEEAKLHSQVNKIYWSISLKRIAEELKKKGIQ